MIFDAFFHGVGKSFFSITIKVPFQCIISLCANETGDRAFHGLDCEGDVGKFFGLQAFCPHAIAIVPVRLWELVVPTDGPSIGALRIIWTGGTPLRADLVPIVSPELQGECNTHFKFESLPRNGMVKAKRVNCAPAVWYLENTRVTNDSRVEFTVCVRDGVCELPLIFPGSPEWQFRTLVEIIRNFGYLLFHAFFFYRSNEAPIAATNALAWDIIAVISHS